MEAYCECKPCVNYGLAMIVEAREKAEAGQYKKKLIEKLESYLRAHFNYESLVENEDAAKPLLEQVGADYLINRRIPVDKGMLRDVIDEALMRYKENWKGKEAGEDAKGKNSLGRFEDARINSYT